MKLRGGEGEVKRRREVVIGVMRCFKGEGWEECSEGGMGATREERRRGRGVREGGEGCEEGKEGTGGAREGRGWV